MVEDLRLSEAKRLLAEEFGCHAVILYGSRARGAHSSSSDWDVLGVRSQGAPVRVVRTLGEADFLDGFVHPESHFDPPGEGDLRFLGGRVLLDRQGFAAGLLERLALFEREGPPPLPADEEAALRAWYPRMLARIARGDVEAHYRRSCLLFQSLEGWFRLRRRWYRGPKESLGWLAEHEPQTHHAFARALEPAAGSLELAALVARIVPSGERLG